MLRLLTRNYRLPLFAFAAAAGVGSALSRPSLEASTEAELRASLGAATGQHVDTVVWEPSRGIVVDATLGRRMLFLASASEKGPRDLYRARVRVSYEGKPLELRDWVNLTNTPIGDEHALTVSGERAAYSTFSFDSEQAVTVLDLAG
ncbi:hypothetical protein EON77_14390, partial [bacterium]